MSVHIDVSVACSIKPPKCSNTSTSLPDEAASVSLLRLLSHSHDTERRVREEAAGRLSREAARDKLGRENVRDLVLTV